MSSVSLVVVALVALLIGVSIPVLLQFRATLKAMERRLEDTGKRLDLFLEDSQVVAHRLARMSGGLEGGEDSIRDAMDAIRNLTAVMNRMTSWAGLASTVGAAVGPAVASAVQSYRSSFDEGDLAPDEEPFSRGDDDAMQEGLARAVETTNNQSTEKADRSRI
jgi:uncharacterized protein YoxC